MTTAPCLRVSSHLANAAEVDLFESESYEVELLESVPVGTVVLRVQVFYLARLAASRALCSACVDFYFFNGNRLFQEPVG